MRDNALTYEVGKLEERLEMLEKVVLILSNRNAQTLVDAYYLKQWKKLMLESRR